MALIPQEIETQTGEIIPPQEAPLPLIDRVSDEYRDLSSVGSQVEDSPDGSILALANELSAKFWVDKTDVVAYKKGELVLHEITSELLNKLIGVDDNGNVKNSGLRFSGKTGTDGKTFSSTPNFHALEIFPKENDPDQIAWGKIDVTISEAAKKSSDYLFTIGVEQFNTGTGKIFNVTLIPAADLPAEDRHQYYKMIADNLKNPQEPDYMI